MKRVSFHTAGCRLNFSETGHLIQGFARRGYKIVNFNQQADVVLLNTCTVTNAADATCRNVIRRAHRFNPQAKLVVVGCYAQMESQKISRMPGVFLVLGTDEKYKVFDHLDKREQVLAIEKGKDFNAAATSKELGSHTRAFLKIQDGCNYVCSFCIIPQARGRSRAISISGALKEADNLTQNGFKEIVLTGVNIGEYQEASGEKLSTLITELLSLKGLKRLRLSSMEPNTINEELLKTLASSPKFMDHFHIPLQSGSDAILQTMKRKYTSEDYRSVIGKITDYFPNAGIGADVIVGFPGEKEEQFQDTYELLRELPITYFHVFPYSKRKHTPASKMNNHIAPALKKERAKALRDLGEIKLKSFLKKQVGTSTPVLFEEQNRQGAWVGHSSNFASVQIKSPENLKNQIHKIFIKDCGRNYLHGSNWQ